MNYGPLHASMTVKFVLFLVFVSFLPLMVVGYTSYQASHEVIEEDIGSYSLTLLMQQEAYLDLLLRSVESLIANVSGVEEIRTLLSNDVPTENSFERLATSATIGNILSGYGNLDGLVSIDVFTLDGDHYMMGDTLSSRKIDQETYQRIFAEASSAERSILWTGIENNINLDSTSRKVLTAARLLKTFDTGQHQERTLGLLLVSYSIDSIYERFSHVSLGEGTRILIVDSKNRLIFHPHKTLIGSKVNATFLNQLTGDEGSFTSYIEEQEMLVSYTQSDVSDWLLISLVPMSYIISGSETIRDTTLWTLGACFLFALLAAGIVDRTMVAPINQITKLFQQIQSGTFDAKIRLGSQRSDEIGKLARGFNAFLDSLEARRKAEHELKQAKEAAEEANTQIALLNNQLRIDNLHLESTLQELKAAQEERALLQQQIIDAQRDALRELSTPLIPISNRVMTMPLIGAIDTHRAQQVLETLLEGVVARQADTVILDLTGVKTVDSPIANTFVQAAQALRLLGARVVLTGIHPAMAAALVELGVDLKGITTYSSLQDGIAAVLEIPRGRNGR